MTAFAVPVQRRGAGNHPGCVLRRCAYSARIQPAPGAAVRATAALSTPQGPQPSSACGAVRARQR